MNESVGLGGCQYRSVLLLVVTGLLLYGLFRSSPPLPVFAVYDKYFHFFGFALVTALIPFAISRRCYRYSAFLLVFLLAVTSEFIQARWLPHRHFGVADLEANIAGILLVLVLLSIGFRVFRSR